MLLYTMLYIVLAYLMLFAALTNSVCLNNASFFFLFKYFLGQGYELSGEIALKKNNHYYYRSSRGVKRKKQNLHSFIVPSFNAQSVKGNDMACKRCEISSFIKDNGVDVFFVTETWLSAQGDEAKTVELAPSGFDVKSFPCQ